MWPDSGTVWLLVVLVGAGVPRAKPVPQSLFLVIASLTGQAFGVQRTCLMLGVSVSWLLRLEGAPAVPSDPQTHLARR
jgi:hypothetical protein